MSHMGPKSRQPPDRSSNDGVTSPRSCPIWRRATSSSSTRSIGWAAGSRNPLSSNGGLRDRHRLGQDLPRALKSSYPLHARGGDHTGRTPRQALSRALRPHRRDGPILSGRARSDHSALFSDSRHGHRRRRSHRACGALPGYPEDGQPSAPPREGLRGRQGRRHDRPGDRRPYPRPA